MQLLLAALGGVSSFFPYNATNCFAPSPYPLSPQDAAPPVLTTNPPVNNIIVADPHLKLPRIYQWNVALEQSVGRSQSLSFTYIGAIGRDLLRATNLVPDPGVNPNFQFVSVTDNSATSDYHALQVKFQQRLSHGLEALASYTFSHSIDIASTDAFANYLNTPSTFASPDIDRGNSDFDIRHAFTAGVTYELPTPGSQKVVRGILGGWSLSSFVLARSAPPVNLMGALFFAAGTALYPRPNVNLGVPLELFGSQYPGGKISIVRPLVNHPSGNKEILAETCCVASELRRWILVCSGNSTLPKPWDFVSRRSSSTSLTTLTSAVPTMI
jgi:hypothetical protein